MACGEPRRRMTKVYVFFIHHNLSFMKKFIYLFVAVIGTIVTACGGDDDEPSLKFENKTLKYEQTYSIPNGAGIEWKSSNPNVASVSGATVTAERVGEATISSNKGSFKVTVTPEYNTFIEPDLNWGSSKSSVKSFMKKVSSVSVKEEDATKLTYSGTGKALLYQYTFESDKLKGSGVAINGDYVDSKEMANFFIERYIPVSYDESDYSFYFMSPDEKTAAMMKLTTSGRTVLYVTVYVPITSKSRSNADFESALEGFDFQVDEKVKAEFDIIKQLI